MAEKREIVVVSGVRTAIGDYGATLKDFAPTDLAARVAKEAVAHATDHNNLAFLSHLHSS